MPKFEFYVQAAGYVTVEAESCKEARTKLIDDELYDQVIHDDVYINEGKEVK